MTVSLKGVGANTLFVEDLERSRRFYEDIFGLQVIYEDESSAVFDPVGNIWEIAQDLPRG